VRTVEPAVVRAWALAQGIPVGQRGALAASVVQAYVRSVQRARMARAARGAIGFAFDLHRAAR
jgi:hypothetical protein